MASAEEEAAKAAAARTENGGLHILGQSWTFPKTAQGTVSMCFLCVAAVALAYVILHAPKEQLRIVAFAFLKVNPDSGAKEEVRDTVSYGFWTPSKDTKGELQKLGVGDKRNGSDLK